MADIIAAVSSLDPGDGRGRPLMASSRAPCWRTRARSWPAIRPSISAPRSCRCCTWRSRSRAWSGARRCARSASCSASRRPRSRPSRPSTRCTGCGRRASTSSTCARTSPASCAAPRTVYEAAHEAAGIAHGEELSADGLFTVHEEECLGVCDFAPAVQVNFCNHDAVGPDADARADRDAARRRGAGAGPRPGVRQLQGRLARAGGPRGGAGVVTIDFEPRLTRNWSDPSAIGLDGYVAAGGYTGLRQALGMADSRHRRAGEGQRSARPRRRRVPDGDEVGVRAARHGQAHLRRRQLRRVRARHVQQPRAGRARAAPAARGHGDRGARDRLRDRLHLRARRVPVAVDRAGARDRRGLRRRVPRRRRLRLGHARRRRVAPRRRRLHLRRGDRAAELAGGPARPAAPAAAVPGGRRPVRQPDRDQQRRDADERARHHHARRRVVPRASAPRSRPARRCSRSAARWSVPATTRSRWARRSRAVLEELGRRRARRAGAQGVDPRRLLDAVADGGARRHRSGLRVAGGRRVACSARPRSW